MDYVRLVESTLNVAEISEIVKSPKCGAVSLFIGTTRDNCDGLKIKHFKKNNNGLKQADFATSNDTLLDRLLQTFSIVSNLMYEAYDTMATKCMKRVCGEVRKRWPAVENIAIYHRLGEVTVMEASVVIAISSPHRLDSLQAVQFAIDALKGSVPIWKKEEYEDAEVGAAWKENKECSWSKASS